MTGQELVCLYQSNLDVNTAAVKELMHGPYTSWLCEMNFEQTMRQLLVRNPPLARENEFLQLGIACHSWCMRQSLVSAVPLSQPTHRRTKHACICSGSSSFTHTSHGVKYSYCTVPTACHLNQTIWPWSI